MRPPIEPAWAAGAAAWHGSVDGPSIDIWRARVSEVPADAAWCEDWGPEPAYASDAVRRAKISSLRLVFSVLSKYLGRPPEALGMVRDTRGRPGVPGADFDFNWSHSGDWAVLAVVRRGRVGVDIEQAREDRDVCGIALRYFSASEARDVCHPSGELGRANFYQLWTAKEAALKAEGSGIANGLQDTCLSGEHTIRLGDGSLWEWCPFVVAPGYSGAVVWRPMPDIRLRFFHFRTE